jgi:uncharacterized membrane protein YbhN (UPF0104 family)
MTIASHSAAKVGGSSIGRIVTRAFLILGMLLALWLLWRGLHRYSLSQVVASVRAVPLFHLVLAFFAAAASYLCLTAFDWLALRHLGRSLPYRRIAIASFVSLSIAHSIGFAGLSSGPIRYRFYSRWGLDAADVAQLVVHCGTTVALGLLTLGGVALLLSPDIAAGFAGFSGSIAIVAGVACLLAVALYLLAASVIRKEWRIRGHLIRMPRLQIALAQVVVGTLNFACVAGCLYAVVSSVSDAGYGQVAATYVTGNLATLVTHVPGGLGVIEGTVMYLLHGGGRLVGPLLVFRAAYFLVPLAFGAVLFAVAEVLLRRR